MNSTFQPSICGEAHSSSDTFLKDLRFWGPGVSVAVLGAFGLVGNILSIWAIITFPKSKRSLFYKLLVTLAIFDSLFITNGGLFMTQQAFAFNLHWYNYLFPKCIYPISGFAMTGSKTLLETWQIVAFANMYLVFRLDLSLCANCLWKVFGHMSCKRKLRLPQTSILHGGFGNILLSHWHTKILWNRVCV